MQRMSACDPKRHSKNVARCPLLAVRPASASFTIFFRGFWFGGRRGPHPSCTSGGEMAVQRARRIGVAAAHKKLAANHKSLSPGGSIRINEKGRPECPWLSKYLWWSQSG